MPGCFFIMLKYLVIDLSEHRKEDSGNYTCGTASAEKGVVTVFVSEGRNIFYISIMRNFLLILKKCFINLISNSVVE